MSRTRSALSFLLLFALASCSTPAKTPDAAGATPPAAASAPTVDAAALKEAIQAREKEWSAAFLAGNPTGIAALYTEDGASIEPVGDWTPGREGIAKSVKTELDTINVTAREDITEEVIPAGNYAVEIGHYSYAGTSKTSKAPVSAAGRYMVLWRKDADGIWRLHRDIGDDAPKKKT
jgi:uncharacterized protein (TIGR02246 family)